MELNAQQKRGEGKLKILEEAKFKGDDITLNWIAKQKSYADDIKAFQDFMNPVEKETKSKGKK